MKKTVIVSCRTLERELCSVMKETGAEMPVYFLPQRLHSDPKELAAYLQNLIDSLWNVDRIMLCVSNCGNSTAGLRATTAELVIPKTRDCLDVLLSRTTVNDIERDPHGIFLTESWMEFFRNSALDFQTMVEKEGNERATERVRAIYAGYENFYVIDTGVYDVDRVRDYVLPLVEALNGKLHIIEGKYEILRKLVAGRIDEDFYVIERSDVSADGKR